MAEPLLTLDTLVERRTIKINGVAYPLKTVEEVPLLEYHRLAIKEGEIKELFGKKDLTLDELGTLASGIDDVCRSVLVAPDEVHRALHEAHKMQIIQVFTQLQRGEVKTPTAPEDPAKGEPTSPPTGASTSPAS